MFKRTVGACLFVLGGLVTWYVVALLKALGGMSGMSAVAVSGRRYPDSVVLWLLFGYFLVSAVTAVATGKRRALRIVCGCVHAMLLGAFCIFCAEMYGDRSQQLASAVPRVFITFAAFFLPWTLVWAWLLADTSQNS